MESLRILSHSLFVRLIVIRDRNTSIARDLLSHSLFARLIVLYLCRKHDRQAVFDTVAATWRGKSQHYESNLGISRRYNF